LKKFKDQFASIFKEFFKAGKIFLGQILKPSIKIKDMVNSFIGANAIVELIHMRVDAFERAAHLGDIVKAVATCRADDTGASEAMVKLSIEAIGLVADFTSLRQRFGSNI
jgi:hypothetical protein